MATNSFFCPICDKNTRHFEIGLAEAGAASGAGRFFRVVNAFNELTGANKIMQFATGHRCWKCAECTSIYLRNTAGDIQEVLKQGTPNYSQAPQTVEKVFIPQAVLNVIDNSITINHNTITIHNNYGHQQPLQYPWLHKHDGYIGSALDLYSIEFHSESVPSGELRDFCKFLVSIGIDKREKIEWELSCNRGILLRDNLELADVEKIYNQLVGTKWINHIIIK